MSTVFDVAKYILANQGSMPHMKLQRLLYYAQAWSLVWSDEPLFDNRIEAWANGPVAIDLYAELKGSFQDLEPADLNGGDARLLSDEQIGTIDAVLEFYGDKSSQWLTDLTHSEHPWQQARNGLSPWLRGSEEITHESTAEYYDPLSAREIYQRQIAKLRMEVLSLEEQSKRQSKNIDVLNHQLRDLSCEAATLTERSTWLNSLDMGGALSLVSGCAINWLGPRDETWLVIGTLLTAIGFVGMVVGACVRRSIS